MTESQIEVINLDGNNHKYIPQTKRLRIYERPDRICFIYKPKNSDSSMLKNDIDLIMNYVEPHFKPGFKVSVYGKNYGWRHYNINELDDLKYMLEERYNMDSLVPFAQYLKHAQYPIPEDTKAIAFWLRPYDL